MQLSLQTTNTYPLHGLFGEIENLPATGHSCGEVVLVDDLIPGIVLGFGDDKFTLLTSGGFVKLEPSRMVTCIKDLDMPKYVRLPLVDEHSGKFHPIVLETKTAQRFCDFDFTKEVAEKAKTAKHYFATFNKDKAHAC